MLSICLSLKKVTILFKQSSYVIEKSGEESIKPPDTGRKNIQHDKQIQ